MGVSAPLICIMRNWTRWPLNPALRWRPLVLSLLDAIVRPGPCSFGLNLHSNMVQNSKGYSR